MPPGSGGREAAVKERGDVNLDSAPDILYKG
jgi:hypothetical protein